MLNQRVAARQPVSGAGLVGAGGRAAKSTCVAIFIAREAQSQRFVVGRRASATPSSGRLERLDQAIRLAVGKRTSTPAVASAAAVLVVALGRPWQFCTVLDGAYTCRLVQRASSWGLDDRP